MAAIKNVSGVNWEHYGAEATSFSCYLNCYIVEI